MPLLAACGPVHSDPICAFVTTTTIDLAFDTGGAMWVVGCSGAVRWDLERSTYTNYTAADGLASDWVSAIAPAPDGAVWFGTMYSGVSRFDGKTWRTYTTADGLASNYVDAIAVAPDGAVWFGTDKGASRFDGKKWTTHRAHNNVYANAVAPDGVVWLGTDRGGYRFDGKIWTN